MDIALRIGNEFLELTPNTSLELEEENPFLQLGDEVKGEYSLPFSVPASDNNMRILGYPNLTYIRKQTNGFEAILYCNGIQHSRGMVKIETGNGHINQPARGLVNLYYLYGLSDFWQQVEDKFLTDCTYGPDISFPYTGANALTLDGGFFAHIREVMNSAPGSFDYAFFPVLNTGGLQRYTEQPGTWVLNNVAYFNANVPVAYPAFYSVKQDDTVISITAKNEFCPFPYLPFVISKVFSSVGYKVDGSILKDPDFARAVLIHNNLIDWVEAYKTGEGTPVTWNMKDMVPRVKIGNFLLGLANRFGWWYDFDYRNKVVTIKQRSTVLSDRLKRDVTTNAGAGYNFTLNNEGKIYSLTASGEEDKITIDPVKYKGTITNRFLLPEPGAEREDDVYFVTGENSYIRCIQGDDDVWIWEKAGGNTFNYKVDNSTDDINTSCLIPDTDIVLMGPIVFSLSTSLRWKQVVPLVNLFTGEADTFYIAYNFGLVNIILEDGEPGYSYPMGSAGCHDNYGNQKAGKSLAFEYPESNVTDRGLYVNNWKYFLSFLGQREDITIPIKVSMTDVLNLQYTDTLVIRNVEYFIKNPHFSMPLKEFSNMDLVRVS